MASRNVIEEIDWSPKPILHPGLDYREGTAYFTVPLTRNVVTYPKAKKDEEPQPVFNKELQTYVVTSDGRGFWYDEDGLDLMDFLPSEHVFQERENRWSLPSVKGYLEKTTTDIQTKALFEEIRGLYTTFVEYADEAYYDVMSLFLMYTYVFRLFESTGYIHFNGTAASGKSRNLSILDTLAFNATWASSMSAASLYRKLAGSPGTTLLDESEGFEGERGEDLRRILNAGYKDGAKAIRTEKGPNDRFVPVEYDVFGPKALASITPLEPVIASRCLIVAMRPAIRELPEFHTKDTKWHELRDRLYLWAIDHMGEVADIAVTWDEAKKERLAPRLVGRQWETSSQYVILADYIGGEAFASQIIEFLNGYYQQQQEALNATDRLRTTLRCLPRVLATKIASPEHYFSLKDIHEVISSYMEADAAEYFKTKHAASNLTVLGFKNKMRASGGLRVEINQDRLRKEFAQRRVEPFDEDIRWLAGEEDYPLGQAIVIARKASDNDTPWWEDMETEDAES